MSAVRTVIRSAPATDSRRAIDLLNKRDGTDEQSALDSSRDGFRDLISEDADLRDGKSRERVPFRQDRWLPLRPTINAASGVLAAAVNCTDLADENCTLGGVRGRPGRD